MFCGSFGVAREKQRKERKFFYVLLGSEFPEKIKKKKKIFLCFVAALGLPEKI